MGVRIHVVPSSLTCTNSFHEHVAVDHWNYNSTLYTNAQTLGDPLTLGAQDAKSMAYSTVLGEEIMISDIGSNAYAKENLTLRQ